MVVEYKHSTQHPQKLAIFLFLMKTNYQKDKPRIRNAHWKIL